MRHPLETRFIPKIELLAKACDCVLWIMDARYEHSLFVSSNYQEIWGRSQLNLYTHTRIWDTYLDAAHPNTIWEKCKQRNTLQNPSHTIIYSVKKPDHHIITLQDQSFHLNDRFGNIMLIAGAATEIEKNDWHPEKQKHISDKLDKVCMDFYKILNLPLNKVKINHQQDMYLSSLTKRQMSVLKLLLRNKQSKEIAKELALSFRTVEDHIRNIKNHINCNTKSEIISKAIELNWLTVLI